METGLDKLLASIDPARSIEDVYNRANEAINIFPQRSGQIEQWDQFRGCMAEFLRHVDFCTLRFQRPINISSGYYWLRCADILRKIHGRNGEKAAFEMARTGNDGGLYNVLKVVAMHVAEDYAKNEISARISNYLEGLSVDKKLAASSEYIAKYGHLLPSELTEGTAVRIHADFDKVLNEHPRILQRTRRAGR